MRSTSHQRPLWYASVPESLFAVAEIIISTPQWDKVPAPQVRLASVSTPIESPKFIQFDDPPSDQVAGSTSFPRLAPIQSVAIDDFARRLGVDPGRPLFIILSVEVGADGMAGAISVIRSCGVHEGDQAAIDYAHLLRWIPGTFQRLPKAMRVVLPVTFDAPQALSSFSRGSLFHRARSGVELSRILFGQGRTSGNESFLTSPGYPV